MAIVELLYFPGCPHAEAAREQLRSAFATINRAPEWIEIDVTAENAPEHVRGFGSPSILVDGRDVAPSAEKSGVSCRLYADGDVRGAPALNAIVVALAALQ